MMERRPAGGSRHASRVLIQPGATDPVRPGRPEPMMDGRTPADPVRARRQTGVMLQPAQPGAIARVVQAQARVRERRTRRRVHDRRVMDAVVSRIPARSCVVRNPSRPSMLSQSRVVERIGERPRRRRWDNPVMIRRGKHVRRHPPRRSVVEQHVVVVVEAVVDVRDPGDRCIDQPIVIPVAHPVLVMPTREEREMVIALKSPESTEPAKEWEAEATETEAAKRKPEAEAAEAQAREAEASKAQAEATEGEAETKGPQATVATKAISPQGSKGIDIVSSII